MNTTRRHRRLFTAVVAGTLGVVAVAGGQQPVPRERAAILLPPRPVEPGDLPKVARGAPDAPSLDGTPVKMAGTAGKAPATGPAWLTGVDPNVKPAAGNVPVKAPNAVRALTPPQPMQEQPSLLTKGIDKFKGVVGLDKPPAEQVAPPPGPNVPMSATAATPFRGTASNGAPVFAGPPAYRWYGWGSVTPGANPFAPTGQYPRASAGWYSITGATPGAFPVPVMNPLRQAPADAPPAYAAAPIPGRAGMPLPTNTISSPLPPAIAPPPPQPQPQPRAMNPVGMPRPDVAPVPPIGSKLDGMTALPAPPAGSKFDPISTSVEPPRAAPPALPQPPVNVPTLAPPPGTRFAAPALQPMALPASPVSSGAPLNVSKPPALPASPAPLPVVGGDDSRWQPSTVAPLQPLPTTGGGTWAPVMTPRGPVQSGTPEPAWQPGATNTRDARPVVRAQAPDAEPQHDPYIRLIHEVCRGRAANVEVRYTGSKKLSVCFEVRGEPEATALVDDISRRPELGPFQIDFCVFVR